MKARKKKTLRVIGIIITLLLIIGAGGYLAASRGLSEMQELVINDVDPAQIEDGVYSGIFSQRRWTYKVNVTVQSGKIVDIQFTDGGAFEQDLTDQIIANQSLNVDIMTGGTVSSKAFLKAVETALNGN